MSKEAAQAFVEKMKSDEAFRARVMAEEDVEARLALILSLIHISEPTRPY